MLFKVFPAIVLVFTITAAFSNDENEDRKLHDWTRENEAEKIEHPNPKIRIKRAALTPEEGLVIGVGCGTAVLLTTIAISVCVLCGYCDDLCCWSENWAADATESVDSPKSKLIQEEYDTVAPPPPILAFPSPSESEQRLSETPAPDFLRPAYCPLQEGPDSTPDGPSPYFQVEAPVNNQPVAPRYAKP